MDGYDVLSTRRAYDGYARIRVDTLRTPGGDEVEREVVEHADAVGIVPVEDDQVVLLRQYRHAVGRRLWEIPAGKLDVDGESVSDAARRELAEEVGLAARELVPLTTFYNSAGWCDELTSVLLAQGLSSVAAPDDFTPHAEEADLTVERLTLADAVAMVRDGEIRDAKTIVGLLLAWGHLRGPGAL